MGKSCTWESEIGSRYDFGRVIKSTFTHAKGKKWNESPSPVVSPSDQPFFAWFSILHNHLAKRNGLFLFKIVPLALRLNHNSSSRQWGYGMNDRSTFISLSSDHCSTLLRHTTWNGFRSSCSSVLYSTSSLLFFLFSALNRSNSSVINPRPLFPFLTSLLPVPCEKDTAWQL